MNTAEWIGIKSLEEIERSFTEKVALLESKKNNARVLAHVHLDQHGNHKLRGYTKRELDKYKILAYYNIADWNFCIIPFGKDTKLPVPDIAQRCEAYILWGYCHGGMIPIEQEITRVIDGRPFLHSGWSGLRHPDYLLGYHILPDMYLFEPSIKKDASGI